MDIDKNGQKRDKIDRKDIRMSAPKVVKIDWDSQLFNEKGKPNPGLPPEVWFAYCVKKAGGIPQIAKALGTSRQAIHANWRGRFPDKYVVQAEKAFGIPRKVLAPHLYE
ncbi:MAG TPA: hypothetical protein VK577_20960 [Bradyrhizobium sp.]|nr:hypothetical protein [Bradyrhizobium sp.]